MNPRRLRVVEWLGDPPRPGDALQTRRGTFYGILDVRIRLGRVRSIRVVRLRGEPEGCRVFGWRWDREKR